MPFKFNPITGNLDLVEDANSLADDFVNVTGDTMTGALNIDVAAGTNLLKLRDGSSNPKLQVQHGTNTVTLDAVSSASEELSNIGFEIDLTGWTLADVVSWSPLDLTNLIGWWDFSDLSTLFQDSAGTTPCVNDGDVIGYVTDKSGNSFHIIQATTADKPLMKVNIKNGLQVAYFDKLGDSLAYTGSLSITGQKHIAAVYQLSATSAAQSLVTIGNFAASTHRFMPTNGTNRRINIDSVANSDDAAATTNWEIAQAYKRTSVNGVLTINGSSQSLSGAWTATNTPPSDLTIGKGDATGSYYGGYGGEIVLASSLTDDEKTSLETYLNGKWAVY